MKLANFVSEGRGYFGAEVQGGLRVIAKEDQPVIHGLPTSVERAIENWEESFQKIRTFLDQPFPDRRTDSSLVRKFEEVKFVPPVRNPAKTLCVFVNYRSHGQEVGGAPSEPVFFFKHANSIVGDGDDVLVPKFSTKPDHEVELGLVIGKRGKDIDVSDAYDHLAGYTVLNDISFRDGMKRGVEGTVLGRNLFKGKVADTALPMGPFLVSCDEVPKPYPLKLSLRVNGEVRQSGTTDDMIFRIPQLVASASEDNTLLPGDIIASGTCSGVGLYTGKYLRDGDLMEAEVEGVGVLRNRVRTQTS